MCLHLLERLLHVKCAWVSQWHQRSSDPQDPTESNLPLPWCRRNPPAHTLLHDDEDGVTITWGALQAEMTAKAAPRRSYPTASTMGKVTGSQHAGTCMLPRCLTES